MLKCSIVVHFIFLKYLHHPTNYIKSKVDMVHYRRTFSFIIFNGSFGFYFLLQLLFLCILSSGQVGFAFGLCLHTLVMCVDVWDRKDGKGQTIDVNIYSQMYILVQTLPLQHYQHNHYDNKDNDDHDQDSNNPS